MIDWNVILSGLAYAALTGIFNLLLGHKSQVEGWVLANPRLAGILKTTRAIGFDPWNAIAAISLLVAKKLPAAQRSDSAIASREMAKAEAKADAAEETLRITPLLVLLVAGLAWPSQSCAGARSLPCDESKLRAIDADYVEKLSAQCLRDYPNKEACPAFPALRDEHRRRLREECPQ